MRPTVACGRGDDDDDAVTSGTLWNRKGSADDDDDESGPPATSAARVSITGASIAEGRQGQRSSMVFTVRLSRASASAVTVRVKSSDRTATSGRDYRKKSVRLAFAPGETVKTVSVTVFGGDNREADERFVLTLSDPTGAALDGQRSRATGTILNDD